MCIRMLRAVEYVSECYSCGVCFRMLQLWSVFQDVAAVECASGCYSCGVCFRVLQLWSVFQDDVITKLQLFTLSTVHLIALHQQLVDIVSLSVWSTIQCVCISPPLFFNRSLVQCALY